MADANSQPPPLPPLLCERCRYDLTGLKRSDVCPECGVAVERSQATYRSGTPMQRSPTWRAWFQTAGLALRRSARWRAEMSTQLHHYWKLDFRNHSAVILGTLATLFTLWVVAVIVTWGFRRNEDGLGVDHSSVVWGGLYMIAFILGFAVAGYLCLRIVAFLIAWVIVARDDGWDGASRRRALVASVHGANVGCCIYLISQIGALPPAGIVALIELIFWDPAIAAMIWFAVAGIGLVAAVLGVLIYTITAARAIRRANFPGSEARLADAEEVASG